MGERRATTVAAVVLSGTALILLAACDNGPSAVETRDRPAEAEVAAPETPVSDAVAEAPAEKASLTANRRETVSAKVARLYERNGAAFGARSPEDYLDKIHAFTGKPPAGTDTAKRPNGDTLYYHASTNTFAVVARDGTPRTMFKPDDGPNYWAEQKASAPTFGQNSEGR
jgi:pyocin large subunit-like protein